MAYGYRNDGGRYIGSLIQNYRDHEYRKSRDEEMDARHADSIAYRKSRDEEMDDRYADSITYRKSRDEEIDGRYDDSITHRNRVYEDSRADQKIVNTQNKADILWNNKIRKQQEQEWADDATADKTYDEYTQANDGHKGFNKLIGTIGSSRKTRAYTDLTKLVSEDSATSEYLNTQRENSGDGTGFFGRWSEDGTRYEFYTHNKKTDEYLPFTVDPKDNGSVQLHMGGEDMESKLRYIANVKEAIKDKPALAKPHAKSDFGLVAGEDGSIEIAGLDNTSGAATGDYGTEGQEHTRRNQEALSKRAEMSTEERDDRDRLAEMNRTDEGTGLLEFLDKAERYGLEERIRGYDAGVGKEVVETLSNPEVKGQPKVVRQAIEFVISNPVQGVNYKKALRPKLATAMVKADKWTVQQGENFRETGNTAYSQSELDALGIKSRKAQTALKKADIELQLKINELNRSGTKDAAAAQKLQNEISKTFTTNLSEVANSIFPANTEDKRYNRTGAVKQFVGDFTSKFKTWAVARNMPMAELLSEQGEGFARRAALAHYAMKKNGYYPKSVAPAAALSLGRMTYDSDKGKRYMKALYNYGNAFTEDEAYQRVTALVNEGKNGLALVRALEADISTTR